MPTTHQESIAIYCSHFISIGPKATKRFLNTFNTFGKWWAETIIDFKYYGALAAMDYFKPPEPMTS